MCPRDLLRTGTFNLAVGKQFIGIHVFQGFESQATDQQRVLVERKWLAECQGMKPPASLFLLIPGNTWMLAAQHAA